MPEVKISKLNVIYKDKNGDTTVFKDFDVTFYDGKTNVIVGDSGAGKTTLLRCIIGLLPYEGDIYFDGTNLKPFTIQERNVSYVSQNFSLYPNLSALNNIAMPLKNLRISGDEIRNRVYDVAELLGIKECLSRKPHQLSLGQCQRIAIARALIKRPNVIIFDEPFSSLDQKTASQLIKDLKEIFTKTNLTAIVVSHNAQQSLALADYIFVIKDGKLIESGEPQAVYNSSNSDVHQLFTL